MVGKVLGNRYEITEQIGDGGMAVVYKAIDRKLNRYVAVKVLRKEYVDNQEFLVRFKIESQAAASLSHPNIVGIYDVGFEDNVHYIVMEYVKGKTLKQIIEEKAPMHEREILDITSQMCQGIEHAHKNHIIHRDIKSHNIIITNEGTVKITDFGIARDVNSSTLTASGNIIGSVHYFSPEQAKGGHIDEKSDLYSLGVVMYEMATGKLPFDDENAISVALKHLNESVVPPRIINRNISLGLDAVILKAMQKNPFDRYINASLMLTEINNLKNDTTDKYSKISKATSDQATQVISSDDINKVLVKNINLDDNSDKKDKIEDSKLKKAGDDVKANKKDKKEKMDKTTKIAIITAVALILVICITVVIFLRNLFSVTGEVKVPLVKGYSLSDAKERLRNKKLNFRIKETKLDDSVEKGTVITQIPEAGMKVKENSTVDLIVNASEDQIKVPSVVGKTESEAKAILRDEKLGLGDLKIVKMYNNTGVEKGLVIRQDPSEDSFVQKGQTVKIYVSRGPEKKQVYVPDLVGKTLDEAKNIISDNHLKYEKTSSEPSDKPALTVTSQSVPAGSYVDKNQPISITVSNGQKPKEIVPDLIGKTQEEASDLIYNAGLKPRGVDQVESSEPKDTVIKQSVTAGTSVDPNTPIDITVSSGTSPQPTKAPKVNSTLTVAIPSDVATDPVNVQVVDDETGNVIYNQDVPLSQESVDVPVVGDKGSTKTYTVTIGDTTTSLPKTFDEGQ